MSETHTLLERLHNIMADLDYIRKRPAEGLPYPYVSHDDVAAALRPLFIKHGVLCLPSVTDERQEGNRCVLRVVLNLYNVDNPTESHSVAYVAHGVDNQSFGPGKALSYAVKMGLLKLFMIPTGEKDLEVEQTPHEPLEADIIRQALDYIGLADGHGLLALVADMTDDQKVYLHKQFNSATRKKVTELIKEAKGS